MGTDEVIEAVVVGDVMLDSWLHGSAKRLAQEAPVPVMSLEATEDAPGGAANTAANLVALGARVRLVGIVGDDACGQELARPAGAVAGADVVVACDYGGGVFTPAVAPGAGRYVKGGDYMAEMLAEAPPVRSLGGEVHVLGYLPDRSTTAIIGRMRSLP